mgnify:CR=1 FL=1
MPRRKDIKKVLVIGSGPIVIGQAAEFDYAGTQACLALKEEGYEVILANSNPATIMTDTHIADKVYMEPLTLEYVAKIIRKERPDAIVPTLGGQTGLNLAMALYEDGTLAKYGVKVIVYNFMPVLDWLRTDLARVIPEDGSNSLYYDEAELGTMTPMEIVRRTAENSNGFSLPGWEPARLAELEHVLELYKDVDEDKLFENFKYFLDGIIPTCEEVGVKMACHPDDPGWPIFGLPRITHDQAGFDRMVKLHDSPCNTLCLCTGSLGSNVHNLSLIHI